MSVYIKGMEMPKGCFSCKIKRRNGNRMVCPWCWEEWDIHDPMSADYRLENCPLVPVPEHGDLIDRDAVRAGIKPLSSEDERNGCTFDTVKKLMHTMLDRAPTIIPADKGGEG